MIDDIDPGTRWEFDDDVTAVFDDMLARSIPQYDVMRQTVFDVGRVHVQKGTDILDLGSSRGEAVAPFINRFGAHNRFTLVETSQPMLAVLHERFKGYIADSGIVRVLDMDIRNDFPRVEASLVLSVLTMMFTPIEHRQRLFQQVYNSLIPGSVLVLVEKVLGVDAQLNEMMVSLYEQMKLENNYTQDQINRKRMSLEGVLVPVTARWNEELMRMAGFRHIDCFWRWMNFAGWVAVK